ncbi:hypothetical protein B0A55_08600 [Friedmanniomyces simplex]|uniref:Gfd2/YDR514C-like C-terminal domain-containing protein n=1 Tax=Friedmanniomyces simplex TaxID=329884 RepID=A0A4V5NEJ9_9PEZI|nr:hypothetical protein B0A55_08600 [Friedmanniomyces simplex]
MTSRFHEYLALKKTAIWPSPPEASTTFCGSEIETNSLDMAKQQAQPPTINQELKTVQEMLGLVTATSTKSTRSQPVFVCIDCEAFEHVQSKITEIGVAVLDTRDIAGIRPGTDGRSWIEKIKYAHYRPVQYAKLRNKNFIKGCAEGFNFGSTSWIELDDAKTILTRIFRFPSQLLQAADLSTPLSGEARNTVFVGRGSSNDTAYLKQVGFSVSADANITLTIDTQRLAGGSKKASIGLHRLLLSLGVDPVNLHNAGNDAAYTLQSMVIMALKDLAAPGIVAAGLLAHQGKLPPPKYNPLVAPHVWTGSAVQPAADAPAMVHKVQGAARDATSVHAKAERKGRKRAARVSAHAVGAGVGYEMRRNLVIALIIILLFLILGLIGFIIWRVQHRVSGTRDSSHGSVTTVEEERRRMREV